MANLFGHSYSDVGNTSSDFLIKTRGQVKIQIGNKFIDLLKDGKLNVSSKFIYQEKEVGTKDGIYVVKEGSGVKVVLVVNGEEIPLLGDDMGTTYVSFLSGQETTSEAKENALTNIGFIYDSLDSVDENSVKNGIIYVTSNQKLYTVKGGNITEYTIDIPNPYPKQFVIQTSDNSTGAILIKGEGVENSLAFDSLYIYQKEGDSYIDSKGIFHLILDDAEKVTFDPETTTFFTTVQSDMFQSQNATSNIGFRLYNLGNSYLEVDNLIVRRHLSLPETKGSSLETLITSHWFSTYNIIQNFKEYNESDWKEESDAEDAESEFYEIDCLYQHKFNINDSLYTYVYVDDYLEPDEETEEPEETEEAIRTELIPFKIEEVLDEFCIKVSLQKEFMSPDYQELTSTAYKNIINQKIYLVGSENTLELLRIQNSNLDIIKSSSFQDEKNPSNIHTRIGNIEELKLQENNNNTKVNIVGNGLYTDNGCFLKARYTSNYELPNNDNSSKFASTEWVNKLIPKGSIIMYNGLSSEIPEGWHICDGTEGTPNLIGKFIKASDTSGETGGSSDIQILEENMPRHTHTFESSQVTTSEAGEHTHAFRGKYEKSSNANDRDALVTGGEWDTITTSKSGAHTHTIDMGDTQLSYIGEGKPIKYEPSFYSLIYIMKIK